MGYGCYLKSGFLITDPKNIKAMYHTLEDLSIEAEECQLGKFDVYGADYQNYHQENYQEIANLAKAGSYLEFIGDDDAVWTLYLSNGKIEDHSGEIVYDSLDMNKIVIPLGDGYSLVAEKNIDTDYKEIFVYLKNEKEGLVHQDLAIVGENYTYDSEEGNVVPIHGQYSVKVYGDPDNEDWTTEFSFGRHEEVE